MQKVKLGCHIIQIRGVSYKPEDVYKTLSDDSVILLRANNIKDGKINFDDVVYINRLKVKSEQFLKRGDILICTSSGSKELVGKAAYITADYDVVFGAFCKVLRSIDIYAEYLGHYFQSDYYKGQIMRSCQGANINNLRAEHFNELLIKLPLTEEKQKAIAKKLDKVVDLIEKRKKQIEKLDELVRSRFIEMFGDCDLSMQQSDWKKISSVAEIVGGSTPKTDNDEFWGGENCWITPAEINSDSFILYDTERKLTKEGVKSCSLRLLPVGTVLLSSRAPIGKLAIAGTKMYCNQGFKNIICSATLNSVYTFYLLKCNSDYLVSLGRGATFKEISKEIVGNIFIPVPPIELQNKFAEFVEKVEKTKSAIKKSLYSLETLKKSLMQKYFG